MGGGTRTTRVSYVRTATRKDAGNLNRYIDSEGRSESQKRVFISFHMADQAQVELLRHQAKDDRFGLEFIDYSVKEPFDEKWKTQCTERINRCSVVVVMIGEDTHAREAVLWEINKAYELGKKVIGVRIYKDENHTVPEQMEENNARITDWSLEHIQEEIDRGEN